MIDIPYSAFAISAEQLQAAARSLDDKAFAEAVLDEGTRQLQS